MQTPNKTATGAGMLPRNNWGTDRPLAIKGLISYRCRSPYGWIMIGATDHSDAMREAKRSSSQAQRSTLQVWDEALGIYVDADACS